MKVEAAEALAGRRAQWQLRQTGLADGRRRGLQGQGIAIPILCVPEQRWGRWILRHLRHGLFFQLLHVRLAFLLLLAGHLHTKVIFSHTTQAIFEVAHPIAPLTLELRTRCLKATEALRQLLLHHLNLLTVQLPSIRSPQIQSFVHVFLFLLAVPVAHLSSFVGLIVIQLARRPNSAQVQSHTITLGLVFLQT
eukprot:Skav220506  [mRNA]  locus=scaffold4697:133219:146947:+ [translate_table: standard]